MVEQIFQEIVNFFGISRFFQILNQGDYSQFLTYNGVTSIIAPIIPLLILCEFILGLAYKKPQTKVYRVIFLIYLFNRVVGRFIALAMVTLCIGLFEPWAIINTSKTWYWFIYSYIVWELGHYVYHYLGHKVRLFWCLHATHHTPEEMNLFVSHAHFFLEAPYADVIRTTICILLGVDPTVLFVIMFIDGTYGAFIHVGENMIKDARFGFLNNIILTPSHHRVHHAKNPLYIDTNYCNLLNIWDKIFGTLQDENRNMPINYGVTRKIKSGNFMDVYFGEIILLIKDVYGAPGVLNKFKYIVYPPGWNHLGTGKTAKVIRQEYLQKINPS